MQAPGDHSDHLQIIDMRDLARFIVTLITDDVNDAFNAVGWRITWTRFVQIPGANQPIWARGRRDCA